MDPGSPPTMPRRARADAAPVRWGLGDFFGIYLASLAGAAVGGTVGIALSGDKPGTVGALTLGCSAAGQFGIMLAGLVYVSRSKGRGSLEDDFGVRVRIPRLWALVAGAVLEVVLSAMVFPLVSLVDQDQKVIDDLRAATGAKLTVLLILAGILAPIAEEAMFRGLLLRSLRRRFSPAAAIGLSALAFAAIHPLLSPHLGDLAVTPALFALGVISGVAAVAYGDLSVSIPLHMGFNLVTLAAYAVAVR